MNGVVCWGAASLVRRLMVLLGISLAIAASGRPVAAQDRADEARLAPCGPGESARQCFERAMTVAWSELKERRTGARLPSALGLVTRTCDLGLADGCYFGGRLLLTVVTDTTRLDTLAPRRAADLFRRGCDADPPSAEACTSLADAFTYGTALFGNLDTAAVFYRRGCAAGSATACAREAALLRRRPEFGPRRFAEADRRSEAACRLGSPEGCVDHAGRLEAALSVVPAHRRASGEFRRLRDSLLALLRSHCDEGRRQVAACTRLAVTLEEGRLGLAPDSLSAGRYYTLGCQGRGTGLLAPIGDGAACMRLGQLREASDPRLAERMYRAGCILYAAESCVALGRVWEQGGTSGFSEAVVQYQLACMQGSGKGCYEAGRILASASSGSDARAAESAEHTRQGCVLDYAEACYALAFLAEERGGLAAMIRHFRRGCELGHGASCVSLGETMAGRFQDEDRARRLFGRACELDEVYGCVQSARFSRAHDPVQEGIALSRACRLAAVNCKRKQPDR
jgi:TPR repeat protein